jgi:hypothetical protein
MQQCARTRRYNGQDTALTGGQSLPLI